MFHTKEKVRLFGKGNGCICGQSNGCAAVVFSSVHVLSLFAAKILYEFAKGSLYP